ncbi:DUF1062 domain-containing protein [Mesorhizobium sp.]|uniref:DUF1062 domain-containing protein n=1 Tax=Mesorhizobium sp. TaxID=1871066 RepID=UPI0025C297EF|nr:DUF1062 domain-containing protein [Mesorhizobium sp.]
MSSILRMRWAIAPKTAPRPHINCNRCGGLKPYHCSGKFRVNANGKRIDAWLIYRCIDCNNSWNFGILERCNRRDIEPALLHSLEAMTRPLRGAMLSTPCAARQGRARRGVS